MEGEQSAGDGSLVVARDGDAVVSMVVTQRLNMDHNLLEHLYLQVVRGKQE